MTEPFMDGTPGLDGMLLGALVALLVGPAAAWGAWRLGRGIPRAARAALAGLVGLMADLVLAGLLRPAGGAGREDFAVIGAVVAGCFVQAAVAATLAWRGAA